MIIEKKVRGLVYRLEASKKLDAMWNELSEHSKDVIAANDLWFNDYLFDKLGTPEEVNRFLEDWSDDDEEQITVTIEKR